MARSAAGGVGQHLGSGGVGEVREVLIDGQRAVVKRPRRGVGLAQALARLRHEGRVTSKLDHPNIRRYLKQDARGLVLEYVDVSLADVLRVEGRLEVDPAVYVAGEVLRALDYFHKKHGRIHGDIKPSNILIARDGSIKLADFDASQKVGRRETEEIRGTPAYMSPEHLNGSKRLDERCDVFSVGVVLYEMLAGFRPFGQLRDEVLVGLFSPEVIEPIAKVRPEVLERKGLCEVLDSMLKRSRAERCPAPGTALEAMPGSRQGRAMLVARLRELCASGELGGLVELGATAGTRGGKKWRSALIFAGCHTVFAAALAVAVWHWYASSEILPGVPTAEMMTPSSQKQTVESALDGAMCTPAAPASKAVESTGAAERSGRARPENQLRRSTAAKRDRATRQRRSPRPKSSMSPPRPESVDVIQPHATEQAKKRGGSPTESRQAPSDAPRIERWVMPAPRTENWRRPGRENAE